jgi:Uma2 family endonuclease
MTTVLMLGKDDHGRPLSAEEFERADYQEGFRYELIEGRLYVSPLPNAPHDWVVTWIYGKLYLYSLQNPTVINYVPHGARVFLPDQPEETRPEPDVAAYSDWPLDLPAAELDWRNVSPLLVVEIISADDPDKDLVRNVQLYRQVPSIREYWIIDPRQDTDRPSLIARHRGSRGWQRPQRVRGGGTYTTPLLPGFSLVMDTHR